MLVFVLCVRCFAGGEADFGWELLDVAKKKAILEEYNGYLLPGKDGKPHAKFAAAGRLMRGRGMEFGFGYIIPAIFAWGDIVNKQEMKKPITLAEVSRAHLIGQIRVQGGTTMQPKFVEKLPDRMIDEYFWAMKFHSSNRGDCVDCLNRIGAFGPRASRLAPELRAWYFETKGGAGAVRDFDMKAILDRIEKK